MSSSDAQQIQALHMQLTREDPPLCAAEKRDLRNRLMEIVKTALVATRVEHADDYSGFSGAFVCLAWAKFKNGLQKFVVIKLDQPGRTKRETRNWKEHARHLDRTHAVQLQATQPGLIVYDSASYFPQHHDRKHREFTHHYATSSDAFVMIQHLFDTALRPWHVVPSNEMEDLNATFRKRFDRCHIERIKHTIEELTKAELDRPGINLRKLMGRDYPLRNPFLVDLFPDEECRRLCPKCVVAFHAPTSGLRARRGEVKRLRRGTST